jgi:AcrR family transcriptional regulator
MVQHDRLSPPTIADNNNNNNNNNNNMSNPKTQRRDASDNKNAILRAAAALFALHGFDVPLETIASNAGVSRTTLYRHFIDRDSLGLAIFESHLHQLELLATKIGTAGAVDAAGAPADGLSMVMGVMAEHFASSAGLADVINRQSHAQPQLANMRQRAIAALMPLLRTAQQAGTIRADLEPDDLGQILDIFGAALGNGDLDQRRARAGRMLDLLRSGMLAR